MNSRGKKRRGGTGPVVRTLSRLLALALASLTLGALAQALGDCGNAVRCYQAVILNRLAQMNVTMGEADTAEALFQIAVEIYRKTRDQNGEATVLNQLGQFYVIKGYLPAARSAFDSALYLFATVRELRRQGTRCFTWLKWIRLRDSLNRP